LKWKRHFFFCKFAQSEREKKTFFSVNLNKTKYYIGHFLLQLTLSDMGSSDESRGAQNLSTFGFIQADMKN
jgi:hypothetical protein